MDGACRAGSVSSVDISVHCVCVAARSNETVKRPRDGVGKLVEDTPEAHQREAAVERLEGQATGRRRPVALSDGIDATIGCRAPGRADIGRRAAMGIGVDGGKDYAVAASKSGSNVPL